jgi:hypothetical protein
LLLAVGLLVAGMLTWAALPMAGAHSGAKPALIAAICCAVLGLTRLGVAGFGIGSTRPDKALARPADELLVSGPERLWRQAVNVLATVPWPQLLIVAVLGLEALHPRRPWHTAVLGVVLLGYLVALHLAESGARLAVFRPQLALIAAGIGLAALSVAAAALPSSASGSGSGWLAVLAAIAAVVAAALALPV